MKTSRLFLEILASVYRRRLLVCVVMGLIGNNVVGGSEIVSNETDDRVIRSKSESDYNGFASPQHWSFHFGANESFNEATFPRRLADVNGDGLIDIIGFTNTDVLVSLSTGNSFLEPTVWLSNWYGKNFGTNYNNPRYLADVNGDKLADVIGFGQGGVWISFSTGSSFSTPVQFPAYSSEYFINENLYPRRLAEVNGDGMADIVAFDTNGAAVSLSTGSNFSDVKYFQAYSSLYWTDENLYPRRLADINGDGLDDIVGFASTGVYVSLSTGNGSFHGASIWLPNAYGTAAGWWTSENTVPRRLADVNGDGLADIVAFHSLYGVYVSLSTGNSFTSPQIWINDYKSSNGWNETSKPRRLADVNGDGFADIVGFATNDAIYVSLSTGKNFTAPQRYLPGWFVIPSGGWVDENAYPRYVMDMNGDGLADIIGFAHDGPWVALSNQKEEQLYVPKVTQVRTDLNTSASADVGQIITFNGFFLDTDNDGPYTYLWKFGDGNATTGTINTVGNISVNHAYLQAGEFTATLEITDRSGKKGSHQITVKVIPINDDTCDPARITIRSKVPFGMWNIPSTWDKNRIPNNTDGVLIQPTHTVILPPSSAISVRGLCIEKQGVLRSAFNNLLSAPSVVNLSAGAIRNRGTLQSSAGVNSGLIGSDYKHATAGSSIRLIAGRLVNETTGKITAQGRGGDDFPHYFYQAGSGILDAIGGNGGHVDIQTDVIINQGLIEAGEGGSGDTFDTWGQFVYGNAYGGMGGSVKINAANLAMSMNTATGRVNAGKGGLADGIFRWLQLNLLYSWNWWYRWYLMGAWWDSGRMYNVDGGWGGQVSANLGHLFGIFQGGKGQEIRRTLRYRNAIWIEPTTMTLDETTHLYDTDQIIIFGGEEWTMDLRKLSPGAIQAEETITLAVGKNSTIDLRGVTGKVFVAKEKVEVFTDHLQLDLGVSLQDLVDAPEVIQHPAKILYHVELASESQVMGEPQATVPVELDILNNGPTEDTYTVAVTDTQAWPILSYPTQVTVNGLHRTHLTFNLTLPALRGDEDEVTVTVTSQSDPTMKATATIQVRVQEQELITPHPDQKAEVSIVMSNSMMGAGVLQEVATVLENLLAHSPVNGPSDEEMVAFLSQFNENYLPTKNIVDQYLSQFKYEPTPWPMTALITFTDQNVTSRVVTSQLGELIGRMRSVSVQEPGMCTGVPLRALNDALENLTDHGHLILVTSSSAEQALDAEMQAKLQARDIKVHIFFTGSCEETVDKTVYQQIADVSGGSFHWLPQGITPEAEITMKLSQVITPIMIPSMPTACLIYGVQDQALNNSMFFSYNPSENSVNKLGEVCSGCDIESLAIHPLTNEIYVGSGDNAVGHPKGHLYKLDPTMGGLHSVGDTGFSGISSLAFDSEGTLWSWAKDQGLATLNIDNAQGQLELPSKLELADLTWDANKKVLYGVVGQELWSYDPKTDEVNKVCGNLPVKTEAIEVLPPQLLPEGLVLLGAHQNEQLTLQVFDLTSCQQVTDLDMFIGYGDVEGLGMPVEACQFRDASGGVSIRSVLE